MDDPLFAYFPKGFHYDGYLGRVYAKESRWIEQAAKEDRSIANL
jgi:hypothetical protein